MGGKRRTLDQIFIPIIEGNRLCFPAIKKMPAYAGVEELAVSRNQEQSGTAVNTEGLEGYRSPTKILLLTFVLKR